MNKNSLLLLAIVAIPVLAHAGRRDKPRRAIQDEVRGDRGPAASASEIPALSKLLEKAGWQATPELSGVFHAGHIFEVNGIAHSTLATNCISAEVQENPYTATDVITSLQAGVQVRGLAARGAVTGEIVKKIKFGTPIQMTVPKLDLVLTETCRKKLARLPASTLQDAYVIQEVLRARISEQTCGRVSASGRIVGLGSSEAELQQACSQTTLEPVAVGYRTIPLMTLLDLGGAGVAEVSTSRRTTGVGGAAGGAFGNVGGIAAQIQQAEDLKARLEGQLQRCLLDEAGKVQQAATADWATLGQLRELATTDSGRRAAEAQATKFVALYDNRVVTCQNDLGERSTQVTPSEVLEARQFLSGIPSTSKGLGGIEWIHLDKFSISKTEVTVRQYRKCVDDRKCTNPRDSSFRETCNWGTPGLEDHPVNCVGWRQAKEFATWVGARLPTEDEWVYASRYAGDSPKYPWGNEEATCVRAVMNDGDDGCGKSRTWPVCSKPAGNTAQGICDMAGNVSEWTNEISFGADVPVRGGSYRDDAYRLGYPWNKLRAEYTKRYSTVGIRLVRRLKSP